MLEFKTGAVHEVTVTTANKGAQGQVLPGSGQRLRFFNLSDELHSLPFGVRARVLGIVSKHTVGRFRRELDRALTKQEHFNTLLREYLER